MTDLLKLTFDSDFSDSSGNGNDCISHSGFSIDTATPLSGAGSAKSTVNNARIELSNSSSLLIGDADFTVSFDFKITGFDYDIYLYKIWGVDGSFNMEGWLLVTPWQDGSSIYITTIVTSPTVLDDFVEVLTGIVVGSTYTIKIEKTASTIKTYIDSALISTLNTPSDFSITTQFHQHWLGDGLIGSIDNFAFSDDFVAPTNGDYVDQVSISFSFQSEERYIDPITVNLILNSIYDSHIGYEYRDIVWLNVTANSSYSKEITVKPNWINTQIKAKIGSYELPIASLNANLDVSGGSFLSLSIPISDSTALDKIIANQAQPLVVTQIYHYEDGSSSERMFIEVDYDDATSSIGPESMSIVLTGRRKIIAAQSKTIDIDTLFFISNNDGKTSCRVPIDSEISLGDTVNIDNTSFVVGRISYYKAPTNGFMQITEYTADGIDGQLPSSSTEGITIYGNPPGGSGIGSNARAETYNAYLVNSSHIKYTLWLENAYFYGNVRVNGVPIVYNPLDTTDYPYYLFNDSAGLLWYAYNVPVYEADGVTQASINL